MSTATPEKLAPAGTIRSRKINVPVWLTPLVVALVLILFAVVLVAWPYLHIVCDKLTVDVKLRPASAAARDPQQFGQWRKQLRARLCKKLKIDVRNRKSPVSRVVKDEIASTMMFNGNTFKCRRQTIEFDSHSGVKGFAYLLLPEAMPSGKLPCVVCLPGHGAGVDHSVGIDSDGTLMAMWDGTPRDFALFYACRGYAVLAVEQVGIGRRARVRNGFSGPEKTECLFTDADFRYRGLTTLGERVLDVMTVLDMLQQRPEIDPSRLSVMGLSAGGTTAMFSAAVDERIKCAVVASAFCTYADSIFRQVQCLCNYVPGLPELGDYSTIAALIAPRSIFIESGRTDDRFPARSAEPAFLEAQKLFALAGAHNNIELEVCDHGHRCFFGKKSAEFLRQHL